MKILLIGSGGREHALAVKLAESGHRPQLYFAPGNPGMEPLGQRLDIDPTDIEGLLLYARREQIDLTVVGPEAPLSLGIVDAFQAKGLAIFGPSKAAAQMEASKAFAKQIMEKAGVPTARYRYCTAGHDALEALRSFSPPYVIKQDGLAAGKGVTIAQSMPEAIGAVQSAIEQKMPVLIEEFLVGQELSVLAICDGTRALPLVPAQDHKRIGDGDIGPNTGGMGAYAPVPLVTEMLMKRIQKSVFQPVMAALKAQGIDYRGVLYAGLMVTPQGEPYVIEFNARFGDPETQVVLPLLDTDLADLLMASAKGDLYAYEAEGIPSLPNRHAVTVVMSSLGYPAEYDKGIPITFPAKLPENTLLFHAGTARVQYNPTGDNPIVTGGGRVLNATGLGDSLQQARDHAYALVEQVKFENSYYRKDIAEKGLHFLEQALKPA